MRPAIVAALALLLVAPAFADSYSNDFEGEPLGSVPAGWSSGQWWDSGAGWAFCKVVANPYGAGQVLQLSFDNDWDVYTAENSNGYVLGPLLSASDPDNAVLTMEFDMYKDNWRAWELIGDNDPTWPVGGAHLNDNSGTEFKAWIGDDTGDPELTDVPQDALIHVLTVFNSATDAWEATWTYGGVDHVFTGTNAASVTPQFFFGGWMFKWQVERVGDDGGPFAQSSLYLDNLIYSVTAAALSGDVDGNGVVDGLDLTAVLTAWQTKPGDPLWNPAADLDANDIVDGLDLTEVISNWTVAASPVVPEPGTMALVGMGLLGLFAARKRSWP